MLIGKHKLAPILSPKKSIEGGIGGILGAALIGVLYGLAINYWGNAAADILEYAIIGAVGGAISQIGTWQLLRSRDTTILKIMEN